MSAQSRRTGLVAFAVAAQACLVVSSLAAGERRTSDHWSFQPVVRHEVPHVAREAWARNPIDGFILARLEKDGIEPSPEAERRTLLRRLHLDLTGLPPTAAEIDEFLADQQPDAYERLVERLLSSPHYGERWGRHWLDAARYADSHGYTNDNPREMWKYRDWVIQAVNRDLPFDQFTIEQIAGDMLPNATMDQKVASGFHRNTLTNQEGGIDPEEYRIEAVVDRVATTGEVFLGLTLGCARCHDHKTDPISQREFYQVFALLNGADEPTVSVPDGQEAEKRDELWRRANEADAALAARQAAIDPGQTAWEAEIATRLPVRWVPLEATQLGATGAGNAVTASLKRLDDGSLLVAPGAVCHTYRIEGSAPLDSVTAVRLETLTHESLPHGGPGLAENGNFIVAEFRVSLVDPDLQAAQNVAWQTAKADFSQKDFPVTAALDGKPETGWAINTKDGKMNVDRRAVFVASAPLVTAGRRIAAEIEHKDAEKGYLVGRFRISVTDAPPALLDLSDEVQAALATAADKRDDAQKQLVRDAYRATDAEHVKLAAGATAARRALEKFESQLPSTLVMQERAETRETRILVRGQYLRNGAAVTPGVPEVLPPLPAEIEHPTRLDLARWLVDPANPLVARVTVNRVWQQFFGRGIVATPNDFGIRGARPTHPELLDWLASEFVARGWSMKALHRLIVTSATYRQASLARPDLAESDPANLLLARQSRLRVEAETIRDLTLAASGLLAPRIGGPSVFPPQPEGVMLLTRSVREWKASEGEDRYRRGMYTWFWRSTPYPFLKTFDAPDSNTTCTRRDRSNTPLQALVLLNDETAIESAKALAARVLREVAIEDTADRLDHAFLLCVARLPNDTERQALITLLDEERREDDAQALAEAQPVVAPPAGVEPREFAAWTSVARVLLNLDEFITRE